MKVCVFMLAYFTAKVISAPLETGDSYNKSNVDIQLSADLLDEFYEIVKRAADKHFAVNENQQHSEQLSVKRETDNEEPIFGWDTKQKITNEPGTKIRRQYEVTSSAFYPCDRYDDISNTCIYIRQIGTTLTLAIDISSIKSRYRIRWFRVFKTLRSNMEKKVEFTQNNSPWNVNIGGYNGELRLSPITETDYSFNYFMAAVEDNSMDGRPHKKNGQIHFVKFIIEPLDINMGALYHGEELIIHGRSFIELPIESMRFDWSLNDTTSRYNYNLPSNMRISQDGSSVVIKELRATYSKVLTCAVYTNKNIFVAKRNFLIAKIGEVINEFSHEFNGVNRWKRSIDDYDGFEIDSLNEPQELPQKNNEDDIATNYQNLDESNSDLFKAQKSIFPPSYMNKFLYFQSTEAPRMPIPKKKNPFHNQNSQFRNNEATSLNGLIDDANSLLQYSETEENIQFSPRLNNNRRYMTFDDKEARLIAECRSKIDCSVYATCEVVNGGQNFCRCLSDYKGNGIFCWLV